MLIDQPEYFNAFDCMRHFIDQLTDLSRLYLWTKIVS